MHKLAPLPARNVGYTQHTFASTFTPAELDLTGSFAPGFKWYPWNYFGRYADLTKIISNSDASVTLLGDTTGPNGQLTSAAHVNGSFVGTAFGGGAYFEAEFKFNPRDVVNQGYAGWPSWWAVAIEQMALSGSGGDQWQGQAPNYEHFIEVDFFEYNIAQYYPGHSEYFSGGMGDWYGIWGQGQTVVWPSYGDTVHQALPATDFTTYHKYGTLWVPATPTSNGYLKFYFDGTQIGKTFTWSQFTNQTPPPVAPWLFGAIDQQHLNLILGTGVNEPLTINAVDVWQATNANNMVRP